VESRERRNDRRISELAPEVARHQKVADRAIFKFDSRRLHHRSLTLALSFAASARKSTTRAGPLALRVVRPDRMCAGQAPRHTGSCRFRMEHGDHRCVRSRSLYDHKRSRMLTPDRLE
jgi:hypothetical protein